MNLELANRFVALRKQRGYSQETLAEKLGVSRQAVSKWERGESSPDTDNLIALANIYEISLDELLKGNDPARSEACREEELAPGNGQEDGLHLTSTAGEEVCLGPEGIYAKDETGDSIELTKGSPSVYIVKDGQRYTLQEARKKWRHSHSPIFSLLLLLAIFIYLLAGSVWGVWHPLWIVFLLVPILTKLIKTVQTRNLLYFPYSMCMVTTYLLLGFYYDLWHPAWLLFLTIPPYARLRRHYFKKATEAEI